MGSAWRGRGFPSRRLYRHVRPARFGGLGLCFDRLRLGSSDRLGTRYERLRLALERVRLPFDRAVLGCSSGLRPCSEGLCVPFRRHRLLSAGSKCSLDLLNAFFYRLRLGSSGRLGSRFDRLRCAGLGLRLDGRQCPAG